MHLRQVRISGFKSFAEPTVIEFPSTFVGVVGPNGCGKSNVIDAVRWVMGETHAGELRATSSMMELIFAGSEGRAPSGRASVEMVLDNSDGKLSGPWGAYSEISIKRTLTRDGASAYFINGQPVRRRDVQDIFMGTGLSSRSYAIISQGMISGVVRAKPEELRAYFEEAAGVSRYRERRREAQSRLTATRGNLDRAGDLQEVRKADIERLSGEAELASKWDALNRKKEELAGVWLVLQEREARDARDRVAADVAAAMAKVESGRAEAAALGREALGLAPAFDRAKEQEASCRERVAQVNTELARKQGEVASIVGKKKLLAERISRDEEKLARVTREADAALERAKALEKEAGDRTREADSLSEAAAGAEEKASEGKRTWEEASEAAKRAKKAESEAQKALSEANFRLQTLGREKTELEVRRERLTREESGNEGFDPASLEDAREQAEECAAEEEEAAAALEEARAALEEAEAGRREAEEAKAGASSSLSGIRATLGALEEIQQKALSGGRLSAWLARHDLSSLPRLLSGIRIEEGWAKAVESALGGRATALRVGRAAEAAPLEGDPPPERLALVSTADSPKGEPVPGTLAEKISGGDPESLAVLRAFLSGAWTAGSVEEALGLAGRFPGRIFFTPEGHAVTRGSVLFWAEDGGQAGTLVRADRIARLTEEKDRASSAYEEAISRGLDSSRRLDAAKAREGEAAAAVKRAERDSRDSSVRLGELEAAAAAWKRRSTQIRDELGEIDSRLEEIAAERDEAEEAFAELDERLSLASQKSQDAEMAEEAARNALDEAAGAARSTASRVELLRTNAAHAAERASDARWSALRAESDEAELSASVEEARAALEELDEEAGREGLRVILRSAEEAEESLRKALASRSALEEKISSLGARRAELERSEAPALERIGEMKVKQGSAEAALGVLSTQIEERRVDRRAALERAASDGLRPASAKSGVTRLENQMAALGPVNHAALEHLEAAKKALDATERQIEDLTAAVSTLEEAIRKIDNETRAVLRDTIARVNANFSSLFQKIFGGGNASLTTVGDEILEAGIEIRAQPPGKRNTTVKLLSGGEQALCATALVFALFQLNPAPFCLLDEVDAPLDDTNQARLAGMIDQMSRATQFVVITHHRITMEHAKQLIGVTMREPGVSRVVSVDLAEAVSYAKQARGG